MFIDQLFFNQILASLLKAAGLYDYYRMISFRRVSFLASALYSHFINTLNYIQK